MTQDELAEKSGISRISIARYEAGRVDPTAKALRKIAEALDVNADMLLTGNVDGLPNASPGAIRVPIYGTIPAGIPVEAIEDIIDYEEVPESWARGGKEYFGLKVKGDSMSPKYSDGDVVIFRKQDTCESGQDCAVMVNSEDATFKRVKLESWGVALIPINPEYEAHIYDNQQVADLPVRVLGVADVAKAALEALPVEMSPGALTHAWEVVAARHGLKLRFHALRHYYASTLLSIGVPDKYAMERMGHATPTMLKAVYQHVQQERETAINEAINGAFGHDLCHDGEDGQ